MNAALVAVLFMMCSFNGLGSTMGHFRTLRVLSCHVGRSHESVSNFSRARGIYSGCRVSLNVAPGVGAVIGGFGGSAVAMFEEEMGAETGR